MTDSTEQAADLVARPLHPTDRTYPNRPGGIPTMAFSDRQQAATAAVRSFDDRPAHHTLSRTEAEQLHAARLEVSAANAEQAQRLREQTSQP